MEKVKRQTVKELIAVTEKWLELSTSYIKKDYGDKTRRETKNLMDQKGDEQYEIEKSLESQCNNYLCFVEVGEIAYIVCKDRRDLANREEVFCKILALLGVEVEE